MATHSSVLAWKITWTEEPGRLQSMGSKELDTTEQLHIQYQMWGCGEPRLLLHYCWGCKVVHTHWNRKWQPTPVFSPGESQGRRSLVGCRLWDRTELDTTEATFSALENNLPESYKWNMQLPYCPAIALLGVYPWKMKTSCSHEYLSMNVHSSSTHKILNRSSVLQRVIG